MAVNPAAASNEDGSASGSNAGGRVIVITSPEVADHLSRTQEIPVGVEAQASGYLTDARAHLLLTPLLRPSHALINPLVAVLPPAGGNNVQPARPGSGRWESCQCRGYRDMDFEHCISCG